MLNHEFFDELARMRENYENAAEQIQQHYNGFGERYNCSRPFLLPVLGVLQIAICDPYYIAVLCYSAENGEFLEYFTGYYEL